MSESLILISGRKESEQHFTLAIGMSVSERGGSKGKAESFDSVPRYSHELRSL